MKIVLCLALLATSTFAFAAAKSDGYMIDTKLEYKINPNKQISTESKFILAKNSKGWVSLTQLKENVILLGRVVASDEKSIHMEYLLVDGNKKPNGVVSTPAIVALFGEPASISMGEKDATPDFTVRLTANKTTYTEQK